MASQTETDLQSRAAVAALLAQYTIIEVGARRPARAFIAEVARERGVLPAEITGASCTRKVIDARHEAMKRVAQGRPDMSLTDIGRVFRRDHSTVHRALSKIGFQRHESLLPEGF